MGCEAHPYSVSKNFFFEPIPNDKDCKDSCPIIPIQNRRMPMRNYNFKRSDACGMDKVCPVTGIRRMSADAVWQERGRKRQVASGAGSRELPGGHGAYRGIYAGGAAVEDGGERHEGTGIFFRGGSGRLCKGLDRRRTEGSYGYGGGAPGQTVDGRLSGELRTALQKLLYGAADGGGSKQPGRPDPSGPPGREPYGGGGTAQGDEPDPGGDDGAHLQHPGGYGAGTGDRKATAAYGSAGT